MADQKLRLEVIVDTATGKAQIKGLTDQITTGASGAQQSVQELSLGFSGLKTFILGAAGAMGVATSATAALYNMVTMTIERQSKAFTFAKTFGEQTDFMIMKAAEFSAKSVKYFSGGEIREAMAKTSDLFETYGVTGDKFLKLVQVAMDVSAAKGKNLTDTLQLMAAGMGGVGRGLKTELGINLADATTNMEKFNTIIQQSGKYMGSAAQVTQTVAGGWKALKNTLLENIGAFSEAGTITALWEKGLIDATERLKRLAETIKTSPELQRFYGLTAAGEVSADWIGAKQRVPDILQWQKAQAAEVKKIQAETALISLSMQDDQHEAEIKATRIQYALLIGAAEDKAAVKIALQQKESATIAAIEAKYHQESWYRGAGGAQGLADAATWMEQNTSQRSEWLTELATMDRVAKDEMAKESAESLTKRLKDEEAFAASTRETYDRMYDDLAASGQNVYDYQVASLDRRREAYAVYVKDQALLDRWYQAELDKIWRENAKNFGGFVETATAAWRDFQDSSLRVSRTMYDTWTAALTDIKATLTDTFYQSFKGNFDSIGDLWKNLMDRMRDLFLQTIAEIAAQKIMISVGATAAGTGAGAGGPLSFLGVGSLFGGGGTSTTGAVWEGSIMTATEAQRQAAYGGISTMTATEAQRQAAYAGTGAAGAGATFNPALIAGLVALGFADAATGGGVTRAGSKAMQNKWANLAFPFFNPSESFNTWKDLISSPGSFFGGGKKKPVVQLGMGGEGLEQDVGTPFGSLGILRTRNFSGGDLRPILEAWGDIFTRLGAGLSPEELLRASDMTWSGARLAGKFDAGDIEKELVGLFRNIGDEIGGELGDLIKGFDGTAEELQLFIANIDSIRDALAATEETITSFSEAMAIAAQMEAKRIGVADINLARYQATGNLGNLVAYISGKYKMPAESVTPEWAKGIINAFETMTDTELYDWLKTAGLSFQDVAADIKLMGDAISAVSQSATQSLPGIQGLGKASAKAAETISTAWHDAFPDILSQYNLPGVKPAMMPSADLASWLGSKGWGAVGDITRARRGGEIGTIDTLQQAAAGYLANQLERTLGDDAVRQAAAAIASQQGTEWLLDWFQQQAPELFKKFLGRQMSGAKSSATRMNELIAGGMTSERLNYLIGLGSLRSFQSGTPYVPYTGVYMLHQGEQVRPASGWTGGEQARPTSGGTTVNNYNIINRGILTTPADSKRWLRAAIDDINRERIGAQISMTPTVTKGFRS